MRAILLLVSLMLAGCNAAFIHDPVVDQRSSRPSPLPAPTADVPFDLVTGKTTVGHRSFANAKKVLPYVFAGMEQDFYCGCSYVGTAVDFASCGYVPRRNLTRASRIEWEHVVPAWTIGHQRQCWQDGGRQRCTEMDPVFQIAEGDLNNLVPAVGEVNADRSNFAYSMWERDPAPMYGACPTVVDFKLKRVQPREGVRGRAARITLYMYKTYGLHLSDQDRKLMCGWARRYPIDDWERERNRRIVRWQGRGNPFVTDATQLKRSCG